VRPMAPSTPVASHTFEANVGNAAQTPLQRTAQMAISVDQRVKAVDESRSSTQLWT
jgi:hypothetical protein